MVKLLIRWTLRKLGYVPISTAKRACEISEEAGYEKGWKDAELAAGQMILAEMSRRVLH